MSQDQEIERGRQNMYQKQGRMRVIIIGGAEMVMCIW